MLLRLLTSIASFIALVSGLSNGIDTCESVPQHGSWATGCNPSTCISTGGAMLTLPFAIRIFDSNNRNINNYMPNTQYSGVLRATNMTYPYKGFVLNVGRGNINGNFAIISAASIGAGNLTISPIDMNIRRMLSCNNGLTHTSNIDKYTSTFTWLSPSTGSGPVTFKSIIVTSQNTFNYVVSLRMNEFNINQTISATVTPTSIVAMPTSTISCSIPYMTVSGISGVTQSYVISTSGSSAVLGGVSPTCSSGSATSSGPKLAFMIDLGADTILGSQLIVDTCLTAIGDTVLFVGTGCPTSSASFRCLIANDDAGVSICPSDSMASQVRINANSRYMWAVVGNYGASSSASSGIRWWYGNSVAPNVSSITPTILITPTLTTITTVSGTPRGTRTPTKSISETSTSTPTISMGLMPSSTSTVSQSVIPSITSTSSETNSPSQTYSDTSSYTSTSTTTISASKSAPPTISRTPTITQSNTDTPIETDTPSYTETPSASYTANPSYTSGASPTHTPIPVSPVSPVTTNSPTNTMSPTTNYNAIQSANKNEPNNANTYGLIGLGVGLGVIITIVVIISYYVSHKHNKMQQKPLSMRNIIIVGEHSSQNPLAMHTDESNNMSSTVFHYSKDKNDSPPRQVFEPVAARV